MPELLDRTVAEVLTAPASHDALSYGELERTLALHETALTLATRDLALDQARAEQAIVEAMGGEKGLGSNEAERKRTLLVLLEDADAARAYRDHRFLVDRLRAEARLLAAERAARRFDQRERMLRQGLAPGEQL